MTVSVLIVEDEFIIAEDLRLALLAGGYTVFGIAYTFQQALELMKNDKPDIALVDITLDHKQSGLLLGSLLSGPLNVPYAYITAHADPATMRKVVSTDPGGFVVKPFKREAIFEMISALSSAPRNPAVRKSTPGWLSMLRYYFGLSVK